MKQGGIAAWNIAPLFKGNAAPCPRPACTLSAAPAPCPGPPAPACTLTASAARSLLGLAAPCPRPACSPAPCPRPTAALCRGQGWQLPAPVPRGTPCCPACLACPYGSLPACCWILGWWLLDPHLRGILPAPPWSCAMLPAVPTLSSPVWGCQLACSIPTGSPLSCPGLPAFPVLSPSVLLRPTPFLQHPTSCSMLAARCPQVSVGSDLPMPQV